MTKTAIVFEIEFRARGYTSDEAAELRTALEEFGAVRIRPLQLPEAGGSTELWIAASFVGGAIVTGLIEHLTGKLFDRLASKLGQFYRKRTERDGIEPEMSLRVSYDDVDLDIGPVSADELSRLPALAQKVYDVLCAPPLNTDVTRIVIGMVHEDGRWSEPHLQNQAEDSNRYWGISFEGHRQVTHIFDTRTRLLAERRDLYEYPVSKSTAGE